jgi:adenylosuccinate synthase
MKRINGDPIREGLDLDDGRVGSKPISTDMATQISRACSKALERRGITTHRFNRMDYFGPNYYKAAKKKLTE